MPWPKYSGSWWFAEAIDSFSYNTFRSLSTYLKAQNFQSKFLFDQFDKDIESGLIFRSDIPRGYGVGSSGALTAAVYDQYFQRVPSRLVDIQKELALIESYFHGSSSGVDPLISYLDSPVWIAGGYAQRNKTALPPGIFFLLDTGIARETGPLVEIYREKCKDEAFNEAIANKIAFPTQRIIRALFKHDIRAISNYFAQISFAQIQLFQEMIPEALQGLWAEGLQTNSYYLKLCGYAGGGGYLLGFSENFEAVQEKITDYKLIPL